MKHILIIMGCAFSLTALGQPALVSAFNANKDGNYREAATYIEQAILIEKSKVKEKTWRYRGMIYSNIAQDEEISIEYPNALRITLESYLQAIQLDQKGRWLDEHTNGIQKAKNIAYAKASRSYNTEEFVSAGQYFDLTYEIGLNLDMVDTVSIWNAAISYQKELEKNPKNIELLNVTISRYLSCAELEYNIPLVITEASTLYMLLDDTQSAISVLQAAREKYPEEIAYITEEYNLHIGNDDQEMALACIVDATNSDPLNYQYWVLCGNIHQNMGDIDNAKTAFIAAHKINSLHFGANYGLGILYNNEASGHLTIYNDYPLRLSSKQRAERSEHKRIADESIITAIAYFEVAYIAEVKDYNTIRILKDLYAKTFQDDKYLEMKKIFDSLN